MAKSDRKGPRAAERDSARAASVRGEHKQMERSVNKIGMKRFEEMFAAVFVSERRARPAPARPCARRPSAAPPHSIGRSQAWRGRCVCWCRKSVCGRRKSVCGRTVSCRAQARPRAAARGSKGPRRKASRCRRSAPCQRQTARGGLGIRIFFSFFGEESGSIWTQLEESGRIWKRL